MMPSVGCFCPRWAISGLCGLLCLWRAVWEVVPSGLFLLLCRYDNWLTVSFALFQMCFHMEPG